jgi:serine/threonine protein phosphatase 1
MTPIYAVGDVHGQLELLRELLERICKHAAGRRAEKPEVILLGDIIDRGPQSREVVEFVMAAAGDPLFSLQVLRGNHEQLLLDGATSWTEAEIWLWNGGVDTVESYGVETGKRTPRDFMREFYHKALPPHHSQWMASLPHMLQRGANLFVHAGIAPERRLTRQRQSDLLWIREPFLSHPGSFPGKVRVFHGHTPIPVVEVHEHRVNLDTGAGSGGPLSAVAIMGEEIVPSDYW